MNLNSDKARKAKELQNLKKNFGKTRPLLVEGADDKFVTAAIRDAYKLEKNFWLDYRLRRIRRSSENSRTAVDKKRV